MAAQNDIVLPGNIRMPRMGLGTMKLMDGADADSIEAALDAGYRLLDTAWVYGNATLIGDVLKKRMGNGKLKREDIFITDKLPGIFMGSVESVRRCLEITLSRLQLDYVDLFLIHSPCAVQYQSDDVNFPKDEHGLAIYPHPLPDILDTWKAMESLVDAGLTKAIGVSNFNIDQLKRVVENARIPVANHQIEAHVYLQQKELREYCEAHGISITAFGSLGGRPSPTPSTLPKVLDDPVVREVAAANNVTPAQVLLGFLLNEGIAVIPKSASTARLQENFEAGCIRLSEEYMAKLRKLDSGVRYYDFKRILNGHPDYPF